MQRRAYVPGMVLLAALVTGCTTGSGTDGSTTDSKPGGTTPAAAPGKYSTLPEPCRAADQDALKDMLPEIADLPKDQQEKAYAGTPEATFDTDRQVGCRWKADSPADAHRLRIGMERVVSYDASVSDDDQAKALYEQKLTAADLPADASPTATPSATASTGAGGGARSDAPSGTPASGDAGAPGDTQDPGQGDDGGQTAGDLQSRTVGDLGSAAFLDDIPPKAGGAPQHTVRVVFRASNVLVTVEYSEQPIDPATPPDTKDLQDRTQAMARKLADQISE
ncbi:DUF3558 domain-containing protein [Streptomyces sp. NBC_00859]|uniref:DUF3558 domain-containing protein n=1 Tax=Streptomyces sp. NBC_00859 TaxID=2903682 RepID=UPI0038651590|nr:DUF3558 domain-containing protein [Streptomyces sp. NBC_00859]